MTGQNPKGQDPKKQNQGVDSRAFRDDESNSKFEIRNENDRTKACFGFWSFEFDSSFEFRISSFGLPNDRSLAQCPYSDQLCPMEAPLRKIYWLATLLTLIAPCNDRLARADSVVAPFVDSQTSLVIYVDFSTLDMDQVGAWQQKVIAAIPDPAQRAKELAGADKFITTTKMDWRFQNRRRQGPVCGRFPGRFFAGHTRWFGDPPERRGPGRARQSIQPAWQSPAGRSE